MSVTIVPRCNGDTCVRCRRKFQKGDRVQIVHIVEQIGRNPSNIREIGAWLSAEFEIQHSNCQDPGLNGTITVGSST